MMGAETPFPRVAINMTTLNQGGVLQRAISFIRNLEIVSSDFDWHLFVSGRIALEMEKTGTATDRPLSVFNESPARNPSARRAIQTAINAVAPDLVFTFAGPSYLRLTAPELMGIADGWVTHATPHAYRAVAGFRNRVGLFLASAYKARWFRRGRYFTVQTVTAQQGLSRKIGIDASKIHIVPNVVAGWYTRTRYKPRLASAESPVRILYLAAAYSHKRHSTLPVIAKELKEMGLSECRIIVTLPGDSPVWKECAATSKKLGVGEMIENAGPVPVTEGPALYESCHICLVPTVLETFSATYVEAMATRTPIVTCDLDFARETCQHAALYFDVNDLQGAARHIANLVRDHALVHRLCSEGDRVLASQPTLAQQMDKYKNVFKLVLKETTTFQEFA